jgi:hypothetical protein
LRHPRQKSVSCGGSEDTIYDNEIGLDYAVAHELNLYYWTFHDILDQALRNHLRFYETGPVDHEVKLHLGLCPDRSIFIFDTARPLLICF